MKSKVCFTLLFLFAAVFSNVSHAETITTLIHKVLTPTVQNPSTLVLTEVDGRVYQLKNTHLNSTLQLAQQADFPVTLTIIDDQIVEAKVIRQKNKSIYSQIRFQAEKSIDAEFIDQKYEATVLEDDLTFFKNLYKKITKPIKFQIGSQCYRRAHNWSYEMNQFFQIKSMKAFLFFTEKHIREHNYNWWFHVAPFVYVKNNSQKPKEMVIERSYHASGPIEMNDWASLFVGDGTLCPEVKSYQEYEKLQEVKDCVIRKVPMYYYQPDQVSALDKQGVVQNDFVRDELIDMGAQMYKPHYIP